MLLLAMMLSCSLGLDIGPEDIGRPAETVSILRTLGMRWVRTDLHWEIASRPGSPTEPYRQFVEATYSSGIRTLIVLHGGHPIHTGSWDKPPHTPEENQAFANWAGQMATSFRAWEPMFEIQNEPNLWGSPDPAAYADLVIRSSQAIKTSCPECFVIGGSLGGDTLDRAYLETLAAQREVIPSLDALSVHPYPVRAPGELERFLGEIGRIVPGLPLLVSEWGLESDKVGEATQAAFVSEVIATRIPVLIFTLRDGRDPRYPSFGLLRSDGSSKPAFSVITESCGIGR